MRTHLTKARTLPMPMLAFSAITPNDAYSTPLKDPSGLGKHASTQKKDTTTYTTDAMPLSLDCDRDGASDPSSTASERDGNATTKAWLRSARQRRETARRAPRRQGSGAARRPSGRQGGGCRVSCGSRERERDRHGRQDVRHHRVVNGRDARTQKRAVQNHAARRENDERDPRCAQRGRQSVRRWMCAEEEGRRIGAQRSIIAEAVQTSTPHCTPREGRSRGKRPTPPTARYARRTPARCPVCTSAGKPRTISSAHAAG